MKTLFSRQFVGVLALLCSSAGMAATVTVVPSTLAPAVNDTFTVTLTATDFVNMGGGTISMTWDITKATLTSAVDAGGACPTCLPATGPVGVGTGSIVQLNHLPSFDILPGAPPVDGNFDIVVFTFQAIASGAMDFTVYEDGPGQDGWFDNTTAEPIPTDYVQASIVVAGGAAEPNILVTDSVAPAGNRAMDFGPVQVGSDATQTVTVTNNGTADLVIGTASTDAPFTFDPDMCSSQTLAPTESCTITVDFTPVLAQVYNADMLIPSNDPDSPSVTVTLAGTGTAATVPDITVTDTVAPADDLSVDFGDVMVSNSLEQTVTVTNDGTGDLVIGTVGPVSAPFSISSDLCGGQTLVPAGSCTIDVAYTPLAAGAAPAESLDIASNDPDEATVSVALAGNGTPVAGPSASVSDTIAPANDNQIPFGDVTIGGTSPAETVTITNAGTEDLVIGTIAGNNPLAAPFIIGNDGCSGQTVTPLNDCTFEVQFEPTVLGAATDGFDIPSNAAGSPITFNVSGTGVPVPVADITVTDSVAPANDLTVPFGNVVLLDAESQTITVTNDGSTDLAISGVTAPAAPFEISSNLCDAQTLAPTESCTITVEFTPDVAQVYNSSVGISSDDPDEATVTVALSGTGVDGEIVIDGGSSAVDPWSLAFLGGLPFLRRRRRAAAMKLVAAAAAGILAAPSAMAADDNWDWNYDGFYLGAGIIGTSLETSDEFNSFVESEVGLDSSGRFEDFAYGGQIYAGWMFNRYFGIEARWSDSGDGESDILFRDGGGSTENIGDIEASLDGYTIYGVANWPVADRWDLFAKAGYTGQDADLDFNADGESISGSDDDSGFAGALGARWRFARHWAATVEGEYLGVDFEVDDSDGGRVDAIDEPWRVGLNVEYWFGGAEIPPPPPPPPARAAAPPPPPPPPAAPRDTDGDGVVDPSDKCADTPRGDRVDSVGCSCDVTRQLTFKTDSAELSDADKETLDEMAANLTRLNFVSGVIEGHTDSTGAEDYNQRLSVRRAQAAADYLASKGISSDRLEIVGRGESEPVGDNATAEGRAMNRRVVAKRTDCGQ